MGPKTFRDLCDCSPRWFRHGSRIDSFEWNALRRDWLERRSRTFPGGAWLLDWVPVLGKGLLYGSGLGDAPLRLRSASFKPGFRVSFRAESSVRAGSPENRDAS